MTRPRPVAGACRRRIAALPARRFGWRWGRDGVLSRRVAGIAVTLVTACDMVWVSFNMLWVRAGGRLQPSIGSPRYFACFRKCNIDPEINGAVQMKLRQKKPCKDD